MGPIRMVSEIFRLLITYALNHGISWIWWYFLKLMVFPEIIGFCNQIMQWFIIRYYQWHDVSFWDFHFCKMLSSLFQLFFANFFCRFLCNFKKKIFFFFEFFLQHCLTSYFLNIFASTGFTYKSSLSVIQNSSMSIWNCMIN